VPSPAQATDDAATIILGFYGRMIIMHMANIFGAFIALIACTAGHPGRSQDPGGPRASPGVGFPPPDEQIVRAQTVVTT